MGKSRGIDKRLPSSTVNSCLINPSKALAPGTPKALSTRLKLGQSCHCWFGALLDVTCRKVVFLILSLRINFHVHTHFASTGVQIK